jgi:hypothetical protein
VADTETGLVPEPGLGEAAMVEPLEAFAQPVQYLKTVDVTFDPCGFTVPLRVAPEVLTEVAEPVTAAGTFGVVNELSTVLHVVPSLFEAESLK